MHYYVEAEVQECIACVRACIVSMHSRRRLLDSQAASIASMSDKLLNLARYRKAPKGFTLAQGLGES